MKNCSEMTIQGILAICLYLAFCHVSPALAAPKTCIDQDQDSYGELCPKGPDCNDQDDSIHPGASEIIDGKDNNCDSRVDEEVLVRFKNPVLELSVRRAANKLEGDITNKDLSALRTLKVYQYDLLSLGPGYRINNDLSGLEYCVALSSLNLSGLHTIDDITPLSGLKGLQEVFLDGNSIVDLSPLSRMTKLTRLQINDNLIADISPVSTLTNLKFLGIGHNSIKDIRPLSNLTSLEHLHIDSNLIHDITPLSKMKKLTCLLANANWIHDVSPIAGLAELTYLDLSSNRIDNIVPLDGLIKITNLSIGDNKIKNLDPISKLKNLKSLDIGYLMISDLGMLAGLTNLREIGIEYNFIKDLQPLVDNPGLAKGSEIKIRTNPLSKGVCEKQIPALRARGINVDEINCPPDKKEAAKELNELLTGYPEPLKSLIRAKKLSKLNNDKLVQQQDTLQMLQQLDKAKKLQKSVDAKNKGEHEDLFLEGFAPGTGSEIEDIAIGQGDNLLVLRGNMVVKENTIYYEMYHTWIDEYTPEMKHIRVVLEHDTCRRPRFLHQSGNGLFFLTRELFFRVNYNGELEPIFRGKEDEIDGAYFPESDFLTVKTIAININPKLEGDKIVVIPGKNETIIRAHDYQTFKILQERKLDLNIVGPVLAKNQKGQYVVGRMIVDTESNVKILPDLPPVGPEGKPRNWNPTCAVFDSTGRIIALDSGGQLIIRFSPEGQYLGEVNLKEYFQGMNWQWKRMVIDSKDRIYLKGNSQNLTRVIRFSLNELFQP